MPSISSNGELSHRLRSGRSERTVIHTVVRSAGPMAMIRGGKNKLWLEWDEEVKRSQALVSHPWSLAVSLLLRPTLSPTERRCHQPAGYLRIQGQERGLTANSNATGVSKPRSPAITDSPLQQATPTQADVFVGRSHASKGPAHFLLIAD